MLITDRDLTIAAAQAGAAVVRSRFGASLARLEKSAGDFATAADIEAEQVILDLLQTARPDDAVLAEESGPTGAGDAERLWLVDVNLDPPFPNSPTFRAAWLLADTRFAELFRPRVVSTTLAVAWVAAGRRAAYVTDGNLRDSVHLASGMALCEAAGCVVTGVQGQSLHTGVGGLLVAADHETHTALLALISDQFGSRGRSTTGATM